jgi:hypothetical protein
MLATKSIDNEARIDRTLNEYMDHRQNQEDKALKRKSFGNFNEYLSHKLNTENALKLEEQLVKQKLATKNVLDSADEAMISMKAADIDNECFIRKLENSSLNERQKEELIVSSVGNLFKEMDKNTINKAVKLANEHINSSVITHNGKADPTYHLDKETATFLVNSLSINLLQHHKSGSDIDHQLTLNHIKTLFNKKIENEMASFEYHQQYMAQLQAQKQHQIDI